MYEFTPIKATRLLTIKTVIDRGGLIFSQTWFWKVQYYVSLLTDEELSVKEVVDSSLGIGIMNSVTNLARLPCN